MKVTSKLNFDEAYDILENSFIPAELKPRDVLRKQWEKGEVSIKGIEECGRLAGVITLWEFPEFVFAENFAVDYTHRNKGIGSKLLQNIINMHRDKRIILEVEIPENDIQKRRIGFYERNGFTLSPFGYIQPSLRADCEKVDLRLMSAKGIITADEFENIKNNIFRTVYKCKI